MLRISLLGFLCLCFTALPLAAQRALKPDTKPAKAFDKSGGEEYQIKQREKWLQESRGLYDQNRPGDLRRDAVLRLRNRAATRAGGAVWTEMGPSPMNMLSWTMGRVAGRVSALAVHPVDTNILYLAAAGGGLWKTVNGGTNWTCLSNELGTQSIGSLFLDPNDPETLWVGTGEHAQGCSGYFGMGLYKSTDGGATLVPMNGSGGQTLDLSFISAVVFHPAEPNIILVAGHGFCGSGSTSAGGVFRSTDGGLHWTKVLEGSAGDVLSDPNDPDVFYAGIGRSAASGNGVYKSSNGGATWDLLSNGVPTGTGLARIRLTMAPSDSATLYVYNGGGGGRIYKTTNGGDAWTQTGSSACEGQCSYNLCLAVSPDNPEHLLVGSIRFARSINSGASLTYLTSGWGSGQKVHQDTHVLVYDRNDANRFWVGSDGGLWRTDDGGTTFSNLNGNLNITQFYDIAVDPRNAARIFGGAQDNSSLGTDNRLVWDVNIVSGDGFMNLVDPLDSNVVIQTSYPSGGLPSLARSTSGGAPGTFSWLSMSGVSGGGFPWVTPLAVTADGTNSQSYMFVAGTNIFMSANHGTSWTALSPSALNNNSFSVVEALPSGAAIFVYGGTSDGKIFRTRNALAGTPTWDNVTGNYPGDWVSDVAVDPGDPNRVFISRSGFGQAKLYGSTTGGTTWTPLGTGLPDVPANSVAMDPFDTDRLFVGTDIGVYQSIDAGATFEPMMDGFPLGTVVEDLEITADPHMLTAGTYGRGAWQVNLALGVLTAEAGPDLDACLGDPAPLSVAVTNSAGDPSYLWTIVSGPDTSPAQFSNPTSATPTFTAAAAGVYELRCEVTDDLSREAVDTVYLDVTTVAGYTATQRTAWASDETAPDWDGRYDRNTDGRLDVRDLLLQNDNPLCR